MTYAEKSCLGLVALLAIVLVVNVPHDVNAEETRVEGGSGHLDGRVFVGEAGRDGQPGRPVEIVFANGTFRAGGFDVYGFGDANYASEQANGGFRFMAQVVSDRSAAGSMVWSGTLDGDVLQGTMRWDHGWESRRYWFRGRVANATAR